MKSSTNRALVAKKQSTSFAQMANKQSISLSSALRANTPPTKGQTTSRKFLTLSIFFLLSFFTTNAWGAEEAVTISFANANQRVSQTTSKQVWKNGDVTFTNDKGASTSDVVNNTNPVRLYASSSITITAPGNITKIVATASSSSYATALKNSIASGATTSGSVVTIIPSTSSTSYKIAKLSAQVRLSSIAITYEVAASCDKKVTIVKGTPETGGSFNLDKTGAQDCCSALTVTVSNITAPSGKEFDAITQSGIATDVTINQSAKTVTYAANSTGTSTINVTFRDLPKYTVTLVPGSGSVADTELEEESAGEGVTLPEPTLNCGNWEFAGWKTTSAVTTETTTEPTLIPAGTYQPTTNITLYAVYQRTEGGGGSSTEVTFNFGYEDWGKNASFSGTTYSTVAQNKNGVSVTYTRNEGSLYANMTSLRLYKTNTLTFDAGSNTITAISFTGDIGQNDITTDAGTCTNSTNTLSWAGSSKSVTFTRPSNASSYATLTSATLTIGGGSTTSYISVPDCGDPCASLQAPNVTATATANSITLSWDAVYGATSYNVYNYTTEDLDETTSLTYTFTGLSSETEYEWGVESAKGECFKETRGTTTTQETCTDAVNVIKGTPSNGSFTMVSGYQSTCNGPVTVTLSNIEPATGYQFSAITQSGVDAAKVTIDNTAKTVTYAKNTTGTSTINVTFIKIPKYTVTLNPNYPNGKTGTFTYDAGELVDGNLVFTYDYNTASKTIADLYTSLTLDGYEFGGWYNAKGANPGEVSGSKCTETGDITSNKTYFAKWSKLYTITLSENGTTTTPITQTSTSYTLPTQLSVGSCQDDTKELVGWSTVAIPNPGDKPTSNFYELGETVTLTEDQTTFYAVFATAEGGGVENVDATLSFESTAQRTTFTTSQQVWTQNGITLTNNKASSTSNVGDYSNPARFYKSSKITVTAPENITKIVFTCNAEEYATSLANSMGNSNLASGTIVTLILDGTSDSYEVTLSDGQVRMNSLTVTYTTGSGTSYSDYTTTCVKLPDPVISFVTTPADPIVFDPVNCGSTTSKAQAKTVQVSGENLRDVVNVSVTGPYKIARTASTALNAYTTSLTLDKTAAGAIHSNYQTVYIISTPPAQSTEATTGTLTFTTTKGNTLNVNLSTPTVTCTQHTLTLVDRGVSTEQPTKYYAGETINEAPADPEGVCTDPIHYVFDGWAEATVDEGSTTYTKVTFPYTVEGNTKFYAVYRYTEGNTDSDKFMSVDKEIGELVSGVDYVLTGYNTDDKEYALSCTQYESGKYKTKQIDVSESTTMYDEENPYYELTTTDNEIIWTITGDDENGYSFQNKSTGKYLNIEDGSLALNNSDPTKYTIEHYVGYDSELGKYVQYLNVIIQPLEDYSYYLSSYYKNSTAGVLFNLHSSSTLQLYLYKRAAATLYTTSPACGPMLEITSGKDIYVTSGYGTGRNTVIAQQTVEYRATRLKTQNGSAGGKAPDVKVTANGITIGGEVTDKVKVVELTQNKELIGDKYTITGTVTIQYTPKANHLQEEIQVQLAVDYNSEAKDNFTVHARSLPAEFVIAAKQGDKWYALNGDMSGNDAEKANGYLQVDDIEDPTKATFAPCNTIYTFDGMVDGGNKEYMRFQGIDGKYLWAASAGNTGIQNYAKNTPTAVTTLYNWQLYTSDNETYQLQNEGNGRKLGLSKDLNFGMYSYVSTLQQDIRILPIEAKCIYNYAPTNLKVSVLKSTSVTLTWDAVAGATKYQYRTDATSWTDAGTEPTVTINALKEDTDYTYYIRAYHEDAGVSQECIDYAEITFTTANCDDVPTNITYTADLNSITVSWTAAAPTATIKLFMNEDGTGGGGTYPGAKSPYKISGGLDKNTTYYIQILAGGTCASQIIPVKTEDVEVDIVEWYPQGIIVDINTDETVGVSLENEVSYGSGVGAEATELFFSKYYEATANVKLVALYNGTKNIIDLTNYEIHYGNDSWEKTYITLKDFGSTKGQIQPGEELILYTTGNTENDTKIMNCVHNQYPDGKWVEVTSSNNTGKGTLSFAGKKTLVLKKAGTIIDVIGALDSSGTPTTANAKTKPSWGDDPGWTCDDGLSITDDTEIGISTNRCLLVRNNDVTSGANAVERNIDDFVTLCSEWKGAQVPDNNVDKGVAASCENFAYVGTFDYSDYYTQYESMGDKKEFDENARNADGTVTVEIPDLYKQSCRNIRITLEDKDGNVLSNREYKVPIMITTTQGTDGQAFIDLRHNLATKIDDGNGGLIDQDLTYEEVLEICKTCDVVIRDNATLQKMADDAENDHPQVRNIYVYENSSLIVPNGTNYTINNLSLRRKQDAVASVSAYPTALKLPESAAAPISLDFRLSAENWHWFTLPYNCNISEVKWIDGTPAQYNVDWFLMTYDGEKRAETQAGGCWKAYTGTTINAGDGFIIAINGNINNPAHTYELRFPMSKEVLAAEETDKTVAVCAWGVETNIRPNHKGWNLVGNPYLDYYQRNNITNFEGLRLGQLTGPDPQTGYWEQTGDVPYIVVPVGAGWIAYEQVLASETDLLPFTAYFVQVGNDGTHNSSQDLKVSFDHTKLQLSATPMPASIVRRAPSEVNETEEPVIVGVALTNSLGESDKTSLVIADRFTNEYEMQADFFKWFGDYYNYYTKPVLYTIGADQGKRAFNALNEELAKQPIPMGMYAAQAGNYTFSLNQQFDLSRVEEVWLYDATQSTYTNLMQSDYTFSTSKVNGAGRFSLSVKLAPKVATSIDNVTADKVWATTHTKQVIVNGLENGMYLWLYDATGKLLYNEPTSNYQHTYSVPQTGTYFVSVMNGNQKQTIKVVVE